MGTERIPGDDENYVSGTEDMTDDESENEVDVSEDENAVGLGEGISSQGKICFEEPEPSATSMNLADEKKADSCKYILCNVCNESVREDELEKHPHRHCFDCYSFLDMNWSKFVEHQETHGLWFCLVCRVYSKDKNKLDQHICQEWQCQYCDLFSGNREELETHLSYCHVRFLP